MTEGTSRFTVAILMLKRMEKEGIVERRKDNLNNALDVDV